MTYPILVESFPDGGSLTVVCEKCGAERDISDDELNQEACYDCLACGQWSAVFKYEEADKCGGCGSMGHYEDVLDRCCSMACKYQKQYAGELANRR